MSKQELYQTVEAKKEEILTLSDKIWEYAELSMLAAVTIITILNVRARKGVR